MTREARDRTVWAGVLLAAVFLTIYIPDIGHGFQLDDHRWIHEGHIDSVVDLRRLFSTNVGFYRPLVALSFGLDFHLWGADARGYAATNLLLLAVCAALLFTVVRRLTLTREAALVAVAVWLFNFHGVNMSLLWLSGRTVLLAGAFGLGAAWASLARRGAAAGVLALAAMLCREDAVMLPLALTALTWTTPRAATDHGGARAHPRLTIRGLVAAALTVWPAWIGLAAYALLRSHSGAFGVTNAPPYYHLTLAPSLVAANAAAYLDRGATVAAVAALAIAAVSKCGPAALTPPERRAALAGAVWFAAWLAVTVFVPVRSSLYALIPSMGSAVAAGAVAAAARRLAPARTARLLVALALLPIALVPIYRSRNRRLVEVAEFTTRTLTTLRAAAIERPGGGRVVVVDDPAAPVTMQAAFGTLFPIAVAEWLGPAWTGDIVDGAHALATGPRDILLRLEGGALTQRPAPAPQP